MCDRLWDLWDNFPYLYAKRAKPSAPTAERAKSTYSAISALCDVKSNPKKRTLSAGPGVGSVGVTVQGKTIRKYQYAAWGELFYARVCIAASCLSKAFSAAVQYSGSNSVGSVIDTSLAQSKGTAEADSATLETPGEASICSQPWSSPKAHTNNGCCSMYSSSSENVNDESVFPKAYPKHRFV